MSDFYVYVYLDPRKQGVFKYDDFVFDYQPMYVGKGRRFRDTNHLKICLRKEENSHFYRTLRKLLKNNIQPIVKRLKEDLEEKSAYDFETYMIKKIGRKDLLTGPLLNKNEGWVCSKNVFEETTNKEEFQKWEKNKGSVNNWKIICPDSSVIYVKNLSDWCQKNNFIYSSCKAFSKHKIIYKGFCFNNIDRDGELQRSDFVEHKTAETKRYKIDCYELEFKNGERHQIYGLKFFCKTYNFSTMTLRNAITNKTFVYDLFKITDLGQTRMSKQEMKQLDCKILDKHLKEMNETVSITEAGKLIKLNSGFITSFFKLKHFKNKVIDNLRVYKKDIEDYKKLELGYLPIPKVTDMLSVHNFKLMHLENSNFIHSTMINGCRFYSLEDVQKVKSFLASTKPA